MEPAPRGSISGEGGAEGQEPAAKESAAYWRQRKMHEPGRSPGPGATSASWRGEVTSPGRHGGKPRGRRGRRRPEERALRRAGWIFDEGQRGVATCRAPTCCATARQRRNLWTANVWWTSGPRSPRSRVAPGAADEARAFLEQARARRACATSSARTGQKDEAEARAAEAGKLRARSRLGDSRRAVAGAVEGADDDASFTQPARRRGECVGGREPGLGLVGLLVRRGYPDPRRRELARAARSRAARGWGRRRRVAAGAQRRRPVRGRGAARHFCRVTVHVEVRRDFEGRDRSTGGTFEVSPLRVTVPSARVAAFFVSAAGAVGGARLAYHAAAGVAVLQPAAGIEVEAVKGVEQDDARAAASACITSLGSVWPTSTSCSTPDTSQSLLSPLKLDKEKAARAAVGRPDLAARPRGRRRHQGRISASAFASAVASRGENASITTASAIQ